MRWWNGSRGQFRQSAGNRAGTDTYAHSNANAYTCSTPATERMRRNVDRAAFESKWIPSVRNR